jgi:dihydropteroate synthase
MAISERKLYTVHLGGRSLELGRRALIMGILNITTDSFSDGGRFASYDKALARAFELIAAGADILDIGAESTRPGSVSISTALELERVVPIVRAVREKSDIPISIDTTKAEVAAQALSEGADIINDISSLQFDPEMARVAAQSGAPVILMHMLGVPRTMQINPTYESVISEIIAFMEERMRFAALNGIARGQIIVDPGIGFGKTITHNLRIIRDLESLSCLERPILLGASRKAFIGKILGRPEGRRELGTAVVNIFGIAAGAHILRVHDVAFHREVVLLAEAVRNGHFTETRQSSVQTA